MRLHHGHAMGAGVVMGVLLTTHAWLLVTVGLVAGWFARDVYAVMRWTAMAVASAHARKHPERWMARHLLRSRVPY